MITGGAGYLGSILTERLLKFLDIHKFLDGHIVVYDNLLYRQESIAPLCRNARLEFVHGDVRNTDLLRSYVERSDIILPLAAIVGAPACDRDPTLATQIIYDQIKFIVDNTSKDQRIILPNTNSGYGVNTNGVCTEESPLCPISHYGREKVRAEQTLLESGNGISLRLATVFGVSPRMRTDLLVNDFVYKAVTNGYIVLFEKDFKRNFIHVQDVAQAFLFMVSNYDKANGNVFNVGMSDANISKWELCQKIKEYIPHFSIQADEITQDPDKRNYIVSNEKIERMGWKPKHSLDDGIQELIKAYRILVHSNRKYTNL